MRRGLFGGTFNPVHYGHLLMAEAARDQMKLDQIVFVPAGLPPHKTPPKTSARHRLAMLRLAIRSNRSFAVSEWEIRQKRVVYTYETLDHFKKQWPGDALFFIIGSDSLEQLPSWRRGKELMRSNQFVVVERPEARWNSISPTLRRRVRHVEFQPVPFASHSIRAQVKRKRSIRYQVPAEVERYIQKHWLYRTAE